VPRPDLARVVDLATQLEADAKADAAALRHRDRTLGRELEVRAGDATRSVHAWLDRLRSGPGPSSGERALRAQSLLRALLGLAGLLLGAAAALALFAYDGSHPVNVVQVLAFFVALQAALLVATALLALPEAWRRRVPGLAALQDVLGLLSPGRWQPALSRLLPPAQRDALERATGLTLRHQRLYGDVQKWAWLVGSQIFAVAFHVAALATALVLVTFSDLAFGWSTTLQVNAGWLERVSEALARPWSPWLLHAVPDRALIEATQYYRGGGGEVDGPASAGWWRFTLLCMVCYGLAPRLVALGLAVWRQQRALGRAFAQLPGVAELRDRLEAFEVSTAAEESEVAGTASAAHTSRPRLPRPERVQAVCWSGLALDDSDCASRVRAALGAEIAARLDAGAGAALGDAELVAALVSAPEPPLFLVKAWEPPLAELLDLFGELREALGEGRALFVLPVPGPGGGGAEVWGRRLDTLGDPWLEMLDGDAAEVA